MIDNEIVKFYNSVKDLAWPEIHSYYEYQRLPDYIKNECDTLHDFRSRKNTLCDPDHWLSHLLEVTVYENLAYVAIPKCACTYHGTMFNDMGWKKIKLAEVDIKNTNFFGLIMHPLERRHKGVAEWIVKSYYENKLVPSKSNPWLPEPNEVNWDQLNKDINTKYFKNLLTSLAFADFHSMPYYLMLGSMLDKTNWIPMDIMSKSETQISLMNFFKLHGHNIQLPLDITPLHVSDEQQLQIYNTVKEIFNNDPDAIYQFYAIYGNDLKFYYDLIDKFTPDWQHIKKDTV